MKRLHETGNHDSLFSLEWFQAGSWKKVHVEVFSSCGELRKNKDTKSLQKKNFSWLQSSSFGNTLNLSLTSYANTNLAVLMEDRKNTSPAFSSFLDFCWKVLSDLH